MGIVSPLQVLIMQMMAIATGWSEARLMPLVKEGKSFTPWMIIFPLILRGKRINYGFGLQTDNLKDLLLNITCQITIIHSVKKTSNICLEDCYCVRTSVVVEWS